MAYEFHTIKSKELDELLEKRFIKCVIEFSRGTWMPHWDDHSTVNFLHFQNGRGLDKKIGTQGFMRSVAKEEKIFLQGVLPSGTGFYRQRYESEFEEFNTDGKWRILQLKGFNTPICSVAERLIKKTAHLLPNSITVKSVRGGKSARKNYEQIAINTSIVSRETMDKESE